MIKLFVNVSLEEIKEEGWEPFGTPTIVTFLGPMLITPDARLRLEESLQKVNSEGFSCEGIAAYQRSNNPELLMLAEKEGMNVQIDEYNPVPAGLSDFYAIIPLRKIQTVQ